MPASPNYFPQLVPARIAKLKDTLHGLLWKNRYDLVVLGTQVFDQFTELSSLSPEAFRPVTPGETFGPPFGDWKQRWFQVIIPSPSLGQAGQRFLFWDCRGETTVYCDGEPWAGLNVAHDSCLLPDKACTLYLDCGTYQTAIWHPGKPIDSVGLRFDGAWIAIREPQMWEIYWDLEVLDQLLRHLMQESGVAADYQGWGKSPELESAHPALRRLLVALDNAYQLWDMGAISDFGQLLKDIYAQFPAETWQPTINLFGHSHLDLVWMWPENVGERKAVNTFSTAIRLLNEYPEFKFMWTSPANYQALERRHPALYQKIKEQIQLGRWEATGGAWVEFDTLIACGEALARSLSLGQQHFKEIRSQYSNTLWLPDCFGFNVALPQLMALAGIKNFATTKLSWNIANTFPYQTFIWRSPDGSQVLTHLDVSGGGGENVHAFATAARNYRQLGVHDELLKWTGVGDGGGGTRPESIEMARRWKNLTATPKVVWDSVESFFDRLNQKRAQLPMYEGELYLEFHRGIYTAMGEFKRKYRALERSLQVWEAVHAIFGGGEIPAAFWERLCFAQFHDALPGSSIPLVYEQLGSALEFLSTKAGQRAHDDLIKAIDEPAFIPAYAVFNPLAIDRKVVVELPLKSHEIKTDMGLAQENGAAVPVQVVEHDDTKKLIASLDLKSLGVIKTYTKMEAGPADGLPWVVTPSILDNGVLRVEFDELGQLQRISENGSAWPLAEAPHFSLYPDLPPNFDAWEIDQNATLQEFPIIKYAKLEVVESGPVRGIIRGRLPFGDRSRLAFDYILEAGSPVLKVEVVVTWREKHRMLEYHLPTLFHGRMARYGAPFGSILRPQVPGMAREEAMWEVPGSRWAAVTDDAGWNGLAIVSEAKYGFSCRDGDLSLTLLRSPVDPTLETADTSPWQSPPLHSTEEGQHTIRYSIARYQSRSTLDSLSTPAQAEALYTPALAVQVLTQTMAPRAAPVLLNPGGDLATLVPSWIKPAANAQPYPSSSGYILRLHETLGVGGKLALEFTQAPQAVTLVDLLEQPLSSEEAIRVDDTHYEINYHGYQILSVLIS